MNDPNYAKLVWDRIRSRGGMLAAPVDLRDGDKVTVTGTGEMGGVTQRFDAVSGVVRNAGWDHNRRFVFRVYVEAYVELPVQYWGDPVAKFDNVLLVDRIIRYAE